MIRKLMTVAVGSLLALSIGSAGAYFTAQVQVPDNVIRAGSVAVSSEPTSAPLAIDALAPGVTVTRSLAVVNDGALAADVVVTSAKKAGITAFYDALTTRVSYGDNQLYSGPMSGLRTTPLRLAPGTRGDLQFQVGLPADADNTFAGDYAKLSLLVDAEQVH